MARIIKPFCFWESIKHFWLWSIGWTFADLIAVGNGDWHFVLYEE